MTLRQLILILLEKSIILLSDSLEKRNLYYISATHNPTCFIPPYNFLKKVRNLECFNFSLNTIPFYGCYSFILALLCYQIILQNQLLWLLQLYSIYIYLDLQIKMEFLPPLLFVSYFIFAVLLFMIKFHFQYRFHGMKRQLMGSKFHDSLHQRGLQTVHGK